MARIMVDELGTTESEKRKEFAYTNREGVVEYVVVESAFQGIISIQLEDEQEVGVYLKDVPMLIKALQAAYNYKQGEKI